MRQEHLIDMDRKAKNKRHRMKYPGIRQWLPSRVPGAAEHKHVFAHILQVRSQMLGCFLYILFNCFLEPIISISKTEVRYSPGGSDLYILCLVLHL